MANTMQKAVYFTRAILFFLLLDVNSTQMTCNKGSYLEPHNETCIECAYKGCDCINLNSCGKCLPGYYMAGVLCEPCYNKCESCSNATACDYCKPGYTGRNCDFATTCSSNYCTCSSANTCGACIGAYYNTSNNCQDKCNENCSSCTARTNCSSCNPGRYGTLCERVCSNRCRNGTCNKFDGTCICSENFAGPNCDQCNVGMFGVNCDESCSLRCNTTFCRRADGYCTCIANFEGDSCENCISGRYGPSCEHICSSGCVAGTCNKADGKCLCRSYFLGEKCDVCIVGQFGANCETNCSIGCHTRACSIIDGNCSCSHNFTGPKCDQCRVGMYGPFCNHTCSVGCVNNICDTENGTCTCYQNFTGKTCDQCEVGKYGMSCEYNCSVGCVFNTCDKNDGTCACLAHFTGPACDVCVYGLFGHNCSSECSPNCAQQACNQVSGKCSSCKDGFYGSQCEMRCMNNCAKCTSNDSCSEVVATTHPYKEETTKGPLPLAAIGGGAGGGVAVILLVIVIVTLCRRRHGRQKESTENALPAVVDERNNVPVYATIQRSSDSKELKNKSVSVALNLAVVKGSTATTKHSDMDKNGASLKTYSGTLMNENNLEIDEDEAEARIHAIRFEEHGGVYYNSANEIQKGKVRVCDLPKFIANKDTTFFEEEFEKLPYGLIKQYDQSQLEGNMAMNRYKGIYPYDESRVKVFGGHTDYINASFIDGYKKRNAFIATLGPMSKQLGDFSSFWRMIWQQKVDTIVMVTNLVEEGKDKCEQYWPNVESSTMYGDIRVSCTNEDTYAEFIRRTFVINLKKEKRNLYHLHFTAWPDKGIPEDVTSIVEFRQKVLNVPVVLGGPTVVHCSAGIGRTGTYIALDILIREGEAENMVDIPGCVVTMRQNRPNMVQTVEQYEYLHHALVHALTFDCKPVARDTFQKYMDGITHDMITRKFTQLHTTVSQRPSEEKEAESRNRNHRDKNRDGADIPGDENRPRLHLNLKPGASDYINAVYINSFRKAKQWILAQTPLPGTVNDFLTLALQENCSCIVGMEPDTEGDKTVGVYIAADNQIIKKGLFAVSGSDPVDNEYMTTRSMTISYRAAPGQPSKEHTIQHLQFTDWDMDRNEPRSPSNFMRFIKDVEAQASLHSSGPVLIHCLTGAGRGGLLCVVAMLTEMMMEVECEVSVVNAIRKIKTRRRGAVPNQEQFAFCHECILEYISSFDTYSNIVNNLRM